MIAWILLAAVGAGPCPPSVEVRGDPAVVASLEAALRERNVATGGGTEQCPALRVDARREPDGIRLSLEDAAGRTTSRTVRDPGALVAVVESWASDDLAAGLLELPAPSPAAIELPAPHQAANDLSGPMHFSFGLRGELSRTGGGELEPGVAGEAAMAGAWLEPTATLRWAGSESVSRGGLATADRWSAELLVGARVPLAIGFARLEPGVAIGAGLDSTSRADCRSCGLVVRDDAAVTDLGMRMEASLGIAAAISGSAAVDLFLGASATPFGEDGPTLPSWASDLGESGRHLALPAPPSWRLRAGAGLRWGNP